jgi:hypothetical protein
MDWIDLAQDRDGWRALVNVAMSLVFHKLQGISLVADNQLACQGLCCMK